MTKEESKDLEKFEERAVVVSDPPKRQNDFLSTIERLASNPDVDVQKIKQIVEIQEGILDRESEQMFNSDMVLAQNEMPIVPADLKNTQTNSQYPAYKTILKHCKQIYTKYGFSVMFYEGKATLDSDVRVCADVMHRAGCTKERFTDVALDNVGIKGSVNKTTPHAKKSSISYGKSTLLCMIFNIASGSDDDGNTAGS